MTDQPKISTIGQLPDAAIEAIAELLLDAGMICELCGLRPAEHFENTPWGERHICTQCKESLPERDRN